MQLMRCAFVFVAVSVAQAAPDAGSLAVACDHFDLDACVAVARLALKDRSVRASGDPLRLLEHVCEQRNIDGCREGTRALLATGQSERAQKLAWRLCMLAPNECAKMPAVDAHARQLRASCAALCAPHWDSCAKLRGTRNIFGPCGDIANNCLSSCTEAGADPAQFRREFELHLRLQGLPWPRAGDGPAVSVAVGAPTVKGAMYKEVLRERLVARTDELRACAEIAQLGVGFYSRVVIDLSIHPNGYVTSVDMNSSSPNANLEACLTHLIGEWTFPAGDGGIVSAPLLFMTKN
jgi:hypothetical protein